MAQSRVAQLALAPEDRPLVDEAFRRAQGYGYTIGVSPDDVLAAIVGELKEGCRDMFGLVKAGRRAGILRRR